MRFFSLNLFNAVKICLSGLSGIWQSAMSISGIFPSSLMRGCNPEHGWGREILWWQDSIKSYGTRSHLGLWFTISRDYQLVSGPWGSLLVLEWKFFSHSLGEIFLANRYR